MKNFRKWYRSQDQEFAKNEMARFDHGKSGRMSDIFGKHVNDVPDDHWYWNWANNKMGSDPSYSPRFRDDQGNVMNRDDTHKMLSQRASGGQWNANGDNSPPQAQQTQTQQNQPQAKQNSMRRDLPWILATSKDQFELPDHNEEMHVVRKGQYVALKDNKDGSWAYATLHKGTIQYHNAKIEAKELGSHFQRALDPNGNIIQGKLASELAKKVHVAEEKKDFNPTEEQQDIFNTFAKNMEGVDNHMIINARAGTGKTTTLKGLADNFAKSGRWLYLVFNSKNRQEAAKEFPKRVEVKTANGFGGEVIAANKKAIPTNQRRMIDIGASGSDAKLGIMQKYKTKYDEFLKSINMSGWAPRGSHPRTQKYVTRVQRSFNKITSEVVGKAKSYGIAPSDSRQEDDEYDIETIMQQHLFDTDMEKIKDSLKNEDERDIALINNEISEFFNIDDFQGYDFEKEVTQAAEWLLKSSSVGGSDEMFDQPSYTGKELKQMFHKNGQWQGLNPRKDGNFIRSLDRLRDNDRIPSWKREVKALFSNNGTDPVQHSTKDFRDFDDDVWYIQQHADEINWPRFDVVLVDEVQDFNRVQKIMLEKLIEQGAKVVAVGDPQQGIYRFRGGDHQAFSGVSEMLMDKSEDPTQVQKTLTKNFRSKPGIIDYSNQNTVVNDLQAGIPMDDDDRARVSNWDYKVKKALGMLEKEYKSLGELRKDTAFIARNNAPLIKAATELMKKGLPFQVQGINLASEAKSMVQDINDFGGLEDDDHAGSFKSSLEKYGEMKRQELVDAEKTGKRMGEERKELEDNISAISAIYDAYEEDGGNGNIFAFKKFLGNRLGGGKEGITLTTAHKSKGLEFDRVFDIAPSLYGSNSKLKKARSLYEGIASNLANRIRNYIEQERLSPKDIEVDDQFMQYPVGADVPNLVGVGDLNDEELSELKQMIKKTKNFKLRAEGDASQEDHAQYVANTRAKHELHILDDGPDDEEEEEEGEQSLDDSWGDRR